MKNCRIILNNYNQNGCSNVIKNKINDMSENVKVASKLRNKKDDTYIEI